MWTWSWVGEHSWNRGTAVRLTLITRKTWTSASKLDSMHMALVAKSACHIRGLQPDAEHGSLGCEHGLLWYIQYYLMLLSFCTSSLYGLTSCIQICNVITAKRDCVVVSWNLATSRADVRFTDDCSTIAFLSPSQGRITLVDAPGGTADKSVLIGNVHGWGAEQSLASMCASESCLSLSVRLIINPSTV